jgi:hypothetical protein
MYIHTRIFIVYISMRVFFFFPLFYILEEKYFSRSNIRERERERERERAFPP